MKALRRSDRGEAAAPDPVQPKPADASEFPTVLPAPVDVRSIALTIIAVIAVVVVLKYAEAVVIPVVLAVLISYALEPLVARLTRIHIPRSLAAALALSVVVSAGGVVVYQLQYEATQIVRQLPEGARRLRQIIERNGQQTSSTIEQVQEAATELERAANAAAPSPAQAGVARVQVQPTFRVGDYLVWGSVSLFTAAMQLILILFLAYFLLASGDLYRRKLMKIAGPSFTDRRITLQILEEINHQIERFLLVQLFTSAVVGVATWLAFRWIGLEQAAFWGLMAGVFNSIPYFGPVVVTALIAVVGFLQFGTLQMVLLAGGTAFVITTLEGVLLTPLLTSRAGRMNAAAVFVGLLFWGWVWEIWGMLLAVPMLMIVKAVCERIEGLKPVGELLSD